MTLYHICGNARSARLDEDFRALCGISGSACDYHFYYLDYLEALKDLDDWFRPELGDDVLCEECVNHPYHQTVLLSCMVK